MRQVYEKKSQSSTAVEYKKIMDPVVRRGDKIYSGEQELRFISANAPTLLDISPWEQEDLIKSIRQLGGQVTRTYTFSVNTRAEGSASSSGKYILGRGLYNEEAFVRMDRLLEICNRYEIRLIVPFIDPYIYNGGIPAFNDFFGKKDAGTDGMIANAAIFYSDNEIIEEFLGFVRYVLNRENTITGVCYKDDPAILAWESGNEMPYYHEATPYYDSWIRKWIRTVRDSDSMHLIMDGCAFGMRAQAASNPDIDIVTLHLYPHTVSASFAQECRLFRDYFVGNKPVIIGEFGFVETNDVTALYDEAIRNGTTGTLLWSLREHRESGGFTKHQENERYFSYHWPGSEAGARYDEIGLLQTTYLKAYEIQEKNPEPIRITEIPLILKAGVSPDNPIVWRGCTGACGYDIQFARSADGPWITAAEDISDDFGEAHGYSVGNIHLMEGSMCYCRMRAKSDVGYSDWTEPYCMEE
ncbi:MAG: cellulase family glycosylhydrolase [Saccharofermentanales bacterium]